MNLPEDHQPASNSVTFVCKCHGQKNEWCPCDGSDNTLIHPQFMGHCQICGGQLDTITLTNPPSKDKPQNGIVPAQTPSPKPLDNASGAVKTSLEEVLCECLHGWSWHERNGSADYYCELPDCGCPAWSPPSEYSDSYSHETLETKFYYVTEHGETLSNGNGSGNTTDTMSRLPKNTDTLESILKIFASGVIKNMGFSDDTYVGYKKHVLDHATQQIQKLIDTAVIEELNEVYKHSPTGIEASLTNKQAYRTYIVNRIAELENKQ